jgi:uncharacterized membrane protein
MSITTALSVRLEMAPKRIPMLPAHIEATVQAIAEVHLQHQRGATPLQRAVDKVTSVVARPRFILAMTVAIAAWVTMNLMLAARGQRPFDAPPFQWLQDVGTGVALYITVLILITQRRENLLAERREQLTLELAILSEQKTAKIIQLLEEMRRELPGLNDRIDVEAEEMSRPADPHAVLDAIAKTHEPAVGDMEHPDYGN